MTDKSSSSHAPTTYREAWRVYWTHPSPRIIALFILVVVIARVFSGSWQQIDWLWLLLALLQWPLLEWFLHRYLLHAKPWRVLGREIVFDFAHKHALHHEQPWRSEWVFLPWYVPAMLSPLLLVAALMISPHALSFLIGLGLAALNYEWSHWLVHTRVRPKNRYYQRLFKNHRLHHFRHEQYWFSFMWPALDRYLGTGPHESQIPFSPTARAINDSK